MGTIGHNNGPSMEPGTSWRRHCWHRARRSLIGHVPIEIVRGQMARAREIGLDYKTYASLRAASGRDVVAFLFSTNALRLLRAQDALAPEIAAKLGQIHNCGRILLTNPPRPARPVAPFDAAHPAPPPFASWGEIQARIGAAIRPDFPANGVVLIGAPDSEREWATASRLGAYLPAEQYFNFGASHV